MLVVVVVIIGICSICSCCCSVCMLLFEKICRPLGGEARTEGPATPFGGTVDEVVCRLEVYWWNPWFGPT